MGRKCCPPVILGGAGTPGAEGPPGPPGPAGPPGEVCVSPGSESVLTVDGDGCLGLVTDPAGPVRPGPGGLTVCVSETPGNTARLDDAGCLYVPEPPYGQEGMSAPLFQLNTLTAGEWHDAPLTITLPEAGTYQIGGAVYAHLDKEPDTLGALLSARLYDQTAGATVPLSERLVISFGEGQGFTSTGVWHNRGTAPVDVQYQASGPTTLVLQGRWSGPVAQGGTWSAAFLNSPAFYGSTLLNYRKIGA